MFINKHHYSTSNLMLVLYHCALLVLDSRSNHLRLCVGSHREPALPVQHVAGAVRSRHVSQRALPRLPVSCRVRRVLWPTGRWVTGVSHVLYDNNVIAVFLFISSFVVSPRQDKNVMSVACTFGRCLCDVDTCHNCGSVGHWEAVERIRLGALLSRHSHCPGTTHCW